MLFFFPLRLTQSGTDMLVMRSVQFQPRQMDYLRWPQSQMTAWWTSETSRTYFMSWPNSIYWVVNGVFRKPVAGCSLECNIWYVNVFSIIFNYFHVFSILLQCFICVFFVFVIVSVWKMFYLSSHSAKVGNPNQTLPEQSAGLMMNRFAQ